MIRLTTAILISLIASIAYSQQTTISFGPGSNNQTFSTCNGFIIDSGGQGGSGYSNNEDVVITVCPDNPGDIVSVVFNLFNLSTVDDNPAPNVTNLDYMDVYDGTSTTSTHMGTYSGTQLSGVIIQPTELNTTGCLTFRFRSNSAGTGNFAAAVTCKTPCSNPMAVGAIIGGITPDSIRVCIGDVVSFTDNGSYGQPGFAIESYAWDFMDGTTAVGPQASHSFDNPGMYIVQLTVKDNNTDTACYNTNLTELRVLVATEPDFSPLPTEIDVCIGESYSITAYPDDYEVEWQGFPGLTTVDDGCITDDLLGVQQSIPLLQTGFESGTQITSASDIISICMEMEHSFIGDLLITLTCPTGQNVILHQQGGGGVNLGVAVQADNVDCSILETMGTPFSYCFTPVANQTWVQAVNAGAAVGNILPAGDYAPIGSLSNLVGCPTNGTWSLNVTDLWAADDGTVFSFSLNLNPDFYPDDISFKPEIGHTADSSFWSTSTSIPYALSNQNSTITVTPDTPGQYVITFHAIDDFGCENTHDVLVNVNELAVVNAGNDTLVCEGNSFQLDPSVVWPPTPCNYTLVLIDSWGDGWEGNTMTLNVNGNMSNYTVPPGGSENSIPFAVNNGQTYTTTFNATGFSISECSYRILDEDGTVVYQSSGNLSGHNMTFTSNCVPAYEYTWTPGTNLSDGSILNPVWSPQGDETITLIINPVGHPLCASSDSIAITVIPPPYAGEDSSLVVCSQDAPVDLFTLLSNNPQTGGVWKNPQGQVITMPFDPAVMPSGNYTYTIGAADCQDQSVVVVDVTDTEITDHVIIDSDCNSKPNGSITVTGTAIDYYTLNGGPQVNAMSPFTIDSLFAGDYVLDVYSVGGCTDQLTFTVEEPDPLVIPFISPDTLICREGAATLTATGEGGSSAYSYSWTLNGVTVGNTQTITVSPGAGSHNYCVTLSEACGSPTATACTNVFIEEEIIPALLPDFPEGCEAHSVIFDNLSNGNIDSVFISFGDGTKDTVILGNGSFGHTYQSHGLYTVEMEVISSLGCYYSNTFTDFITVYPVPDANFNASPTPVSMFDPTVHLTDISTGNIDQYQWVMPGANPSYSSLQSPKITYPQGETGVYPITLYVTTEYGCTDSITKNVEVVNDVMLFAPNTFTPDGDEFNQTWKVYIQGIDDYSFHLQIYNRWGELIFESYDRDFGWDGTFNGKIVQSGSYTWTISARDLFNDKKYTFNGHVSILR